MKETIDYKKKESLAPAKTISWFEDWFDSDYYHILYQERDEEEAKIFLTNLLQKLIITPTHRILDLACGRGRHSNYLAALGYPVTGLDLSPASIAYARHEATPNASFGVQDMRQPFGHATYDVVLNLFTSFGYFENEAENVKVMQHISNALTPNGLVVIEYMNPIFVAQHLIETEIKTINGIAFKITKKIEDDFVFKHIGFTHYGKAHSFTERVMMINRQHFKEYFDAAGLHLHCIYGDYELNSYNEQTSPRMILVAKK